MDNVTDNKERHRFELQLDGETAFIDYREVDGGALALVHSEVPKALEGRGVGSQMAKGTFDLLRARGQKARLACDFLVAYAARHPEIANVIAH